MPKHDESLLANDALAVPVAVPVAQPRSSQGVANLYPAAVDASYDVAAPAVHADAVVEGKILRQVNTVRPCRDVGFAGLFLLCIVGSFIAGSTVVGDVKHAGELLQACNAFKESPQYKALTPSPGVPSDGAVDAPIEDGLPALVGGLGVVVGISVLVSIMYLWSLETHSRCITWSSVCMWPVSLFLSGVYLLINAATVEDI